MNKLNSKKDLNKSRILKFRFYPQKSAVRVQVISSGDIPVVGFQDDFGDRLKQRVQILIVK